MKNGMNKSLYSLKDEDTECATDVMEDDQLIGAIDSEVSSSLIGLDNSNAGSLIGGGGTSSSSSNLTGGFQTDSSLLIGGLNENTRATANQQVDSNSSLLIGSIASFPSDTDESSSLIGQPSRFSDAGQFYSIPLSSDNQGMN